MNFHHCTGNFMWAGLGIVPNFLSLLLYATDTTIMNFWQYLILRSIFFLQNLSQRKPKFSSATTEGCRSTNRETALSKLSTVSSKKHRIS